MIRFCCLHSATPGTFEYCRGSKPIKVDDCHWSISMHVSSSCLISPSIKCIFLHVERMRTPFQFCCPSMTKWNGGKLW
ncbi:unnamed protein product [Linum tenue]|uniref:Uncharacterized protein n=1 Tax=Linum tenue TaxID=586396 RepID=A0AAV0Q2C1_9ROSI|nr:unnamed protein product [Linum tenue]